MNYWVRLFGKLGQHRDKHKYIVHVLWALPLVLIIRLIRPLLLIRLGYLNSVRIGHFTPDTAEHIALSKVTPKNCLDWYWIPDRVSNKQWSLMVKRTLTVHNWTKYLDWCNRLLPGGDAHYRPSTYRGSRDQDGLAYKLNLAMPFLAQEERRAVAWLQSHGWTEGQPFVCLMVRDAEYLKAHPDHGNNETSCQALEYHNFRDTSISDYIPAITWLTERNVFVCRMGTLASERITVKNKRIIDYPFHDRKDDLLDVWLLANCTACISTATGPDFISYTYRKPLLFVNALPLKYMWSYAQCVWVPKHLSWSTTKRPLTLREHLKYGLLHSEDYHQTGIAVKDLDPKEILDAVKELWERIEGVWTDSDADLELQKRYWEIFRTAEDFDELHGWINEDAKASITWLRKEGPEFLM